MVDDETVAIKCKNVDASFLGKLCTYGFIVCKDEFLAAVDAGKVGIEWVPYGTGPYVITKFNPDSEIILQANEDYWRGPARIKTVNYQILSDNNTISVAFEAGDLDFIVVPSAKWATISANPNYNTYLSPTNHTSFFMINVNNDDALSNKLVRQALSYGMDRESMVIAAYDGIATLAYSILQRNRSNVPRILLSDSAIQGPLFNEEGFKFSAIRKLSQHLPVHLQVLFIKLAVLVLSICDFHSSALSA